MRKIISCLPVCFILITCIGIHVSHKASRIEPNLIITTNWSPKQYKDIGGRSEYDYINRETIDCITTNSIDEDFYKFLIFSIDDTVLISVHNSYIGSNVDSIHIFIDGAAESSLIAVHPDCSWVRLGCIRILMGGIMISDNCEVKSTTPVHVNVHIVINPMVENVNKSWKDYVKKRTDVIFDSISMKLDSIIKNVEDY